MRTGRTLLLHFGAVDYRAEVWIGGRHVGVARGRPHALHRRGRRAFEEDFDIVVRAEDDPHDISQPRGKQDWQLEPALDLVPTARRASGSRSGWSRCRVST